MPSDLVLLLLLSSCSLLLCDENVTVELGENATLQCSGPRHSPITMLQWKKPDLKSESYVFFFREQHVNNDYQDERFRGRVELRDPEMKNGDVSIVLKNVTTNDSGTYECKVSVKPSRRSRVRRHEPEPVSIVRLTVTEPGRTDGATGGGDQGGHSAFIAAAAAAVVVVLAVIAVIGGLIVVLIRRRKNADQPAGDDDAELEALSSKERRTE